MTTVTPKKPARAKVKSGDGEDALFGRVVGIIEAARGRVLRTVNTEMVQAYWLIGREIVEVEQQGAKRAGYGDEVIERLAQGLAKEWGPGFGARTLERSRRFYLTYPQGPVLDSESAGKISTAVLSESGGGQKSTAALSESSGSRDFHPSLGWTHYLLLMKVENSDARSFYEIEAVKENWSSRELERQIASLLFERLAKSRDRDKVLALARKGNVVQEPKDVLKDPFVLEFLELDERAAWRERDLEQAIIDRIEDFLLEFGKGFCFVGRQRRITVDGDHFYVDLVFYNRLLRCFVLVDLKLGKLTHQDLGQMQMYVNYFDQVQREEHEEPTIGIVLCSDKNNAMAKITLASNNKRILTSRYQMYLPTEEELRAEVARERAEAERALRLKGPREEPK